MLGFFRLTPNRILRDMARNAGVLWLTPNHAAQRRQSRLARRGFWLTPNRACRGRMPGVASDAAGSGGEERGQLNAHAPHTQAPNTPRARTPRTAHHTHAANANSAQTSRHTARAHTHHATPWAWRRQLSEGLRRYAEAVRHGGGASHWDPPGKRALPLTPIGTGPL